MKIRLLKVPQNDNKGKYNQLTVDFRNITTDKIDTKKIMSFTFPDVFTALKDAQPDSEFTITSEKNERGYWDWTAASSGVGGNDPSPNPVSDGVANRSRDSVPSRKAPERNWETSQERGNRQVLIVRQNALSNAVASLGAGSKREDVIALAQFYFDWTFRMQVDAAEAYLSNTPDVIK